ncbi:Thymidylate synthase ThyX [Candidatus Burarchaeum australiense]|nr:Thymidylate synthase ThyX [Candidatus Burarchaeum australiense]
MYASNLREVSGLAASMQNELSCTIPSFVKRASPSDKHGSRTRAYIGETRLAMEELSSALLSDAKPAPTEDVVLVDYDEKGEEKAIAAMLYPYSRLPMRQLREFVAGMGSQEGCKAIAEYMGTRENRRHRPGRALETVYYTFDVLGNYGMYRDLHRHRMLTQERQELTTLHGYDDPEELAAIGFKDEFEKCMQAADSAYREIPKKMPAQAQYVVPLAYRLRWYMKLNLREVFHMTELRSSPQGHIDYRRVAQKMFLKVKEVHPSLAEYIKFVDMSGGQKLERLDAEKRTDSKLAELEKKYGKK